ncbi:MAG: prepilin-type N-terminal cleavage/methylation domain-containing protein [Candidatus Magnetoovum sp. WYHC-5]|nr:prepilin-type N-terminal cleavage/methylation domain-containing protein [Candidatus Magnetoovum sp. WYHC-5]
MLRRTNSGYTLIEVIIALAIFTAMSVFCVITLNQALKQYKSVMDDGLRFWDYAKGFWLVKSFNSIFDYYISIDGRNAVPYFYCDANVISYATTAPLANEGPVIAWIIKEKSATQGYSLVYYEMPIYTGGVKDIEKLYKSGHYKDGTRAIIIDNIYKATFQVYVMDLNTAKSAWVNVYNSISGRTLPEFIALSYNGPDKRNSIIFNVRNNSRFKEPDVE